MIAKQNGDGHPASTGAKSFISLPSSIHPSISGVYHNPSHSGGEHTKKNPPSGGHCTASSGLPPGSLCCWTSLQYRDTQEILGTQTLVLFQFNLLCEMADTVQSEKANYITNIILLQR